MHICAGTISWRVRFFLDRDSSWRPTPRYRGTFSSTTGGRKRKGDRRGRGELVCHVDRRRGMLSFLFFLEEPLFSRGRKTADNNSEETERPYSVLPYCGPLRTPRAISANPNAVKTSRDHAPGASPLPISYTLRRP